MDFEVDRNLLETFTKKDLDKSLISSINNSTITDLFKVTNFSNYQFEKRNFK